MCGSGSIAVQAFRGRVVFVLAVFLLQAVELRLSFHPGEFICLVGFVPGLVRNLCRDLL